MTVLEDGPPDCPYCAKVAAMVDRHADNPRLVFTTRKCQRHVNEEYKT
ncbi:MAG: hypothetical protein MPK62_00980 [Alphaproteobacteria bacterium]|nr:hypothetical protein [Alphaproteobacteria bacterium]MDA8029708.1 hypothetical protein [Alphaproteobacteria bacterium]